MHGHTARLVEEACEHIAVPLWRSVRVVGVLRSQSGCRQPANGGCRAGSFTLLHPPHVRWHRNTHQDRVFWFLPVVTKRRAVERVALRQGVGERRRVAVGFGVLPLFVDMLLEELAPPAGREHEHRERLEGLLPRRRRLRLLRELLAPPRRLCLARRDAALVFGDGVFELALAAVHVGDDAFEVRADALVAQLLQEDADRLMRLHRVELGIGHLRLLRQPRRLPQLVHRGGEGGCLPVCGYAYIAVGWVGGQRRVRLWERAEGATGRP
mmetsp:Transcript_10384/g.32176  ORF Transcript_10384/g.32176 Transcript_10384/m.32176 type:complete len:268 (-) Transcript_10384:1089-1892(-)